MELAQNIARERILMRRTINKICSRHDPWLSLPIAERETLSRRMERSCFEANIAQCSYDGIDRLFADKKFTERYSLICSRVLNNLNIEGSIASTYLIKNILDGIIDPYQVGKLTSHELCPDASRQERDEISRRQNQRVKLKVSRAHTCWKCGGNETTSYEYQSRSADEASTLSIKCINCSTVWRK